MKTNFLCRNALPRAWGILSKFKMLAILALLSFNVVLHGQSTETCLIGKKLERTAPNLMSDANSKFAACTDSGPASGVYNSTQDSWKHDQECSYIPCSNWSNENGYDGLPGCLKLRGPNPDNAGCTSNPNLTYDRAFINNFPIEGGKTHTISVRCKTLDDCHSPVLLIQLQGYDSGTPVSNTQKNFRFSTSEAGEWEEFSFFFQMPDEVDNMRIQIANNTIETSRDVPYADQDKGMIAYIDDVYIGLGKSFGDEPSCKTPFDGEQVKVDELGNMYVKNGTEWEWFFPFVLHGDGYRANELNDPADPSDDGWKLYSKQGFNAIITGSADYMVDDAVDAGLKVVPHLGGYYALFLNDNGTPGNYADDTGCCRRSLDYLRDRLDHINSVGIDNLLYYYIDNEVHQRWVEMVAATQEVMQWEAEITGGNRIAPIQMLNGTPGLAPKYLNDNCHVGDITGGYIKWFNNNTNQLRQLDHQNNQRMPTNIAQINGEQQVRARLYGAIAHGAKGMNFWRDFSPSNPSWTWDRDITNNVWWDEFPQLVDEIKAMEELIKQPHWTRTWGVSGCTDNNNIDCVHGDIVYGTRELDGKGYIIVANHGIETVTLTLNISGLPFSNADIKIIDPVNFPAGTIVSNGMVNSQIQITLDRDDAEVFRIEGNIPSVSECLDDLVVSGNLTGLHQATQTLTTNGTTEVLGSNSAELKAGQTVNLKPGFKAHSGSIFRAYIAPCDNASLTCTNCPSLPPFTNGVASKKGESEVQIKHYPNPSRKEVNLEFNLNTEADTELIITDVNGKTVTVISSREISRGIQMIQIPTKDWIPGVYFYQLNINEKDTGVTKQANGTLIKM